MFIEKPMIGEHFWLFYIFSVNNLLFFLFLYSYLSAWQPRREAIIFVQCNKEMGALRKEVTTLLLAELLFIIFIRLAALEFALLISNFVSLEDLRLLVFAKMCFWKTDRLGNIMVAPPFYNTIYRINYRLQNVTWIVAVGVYS